MIVNCDSEREPGDQVNLMFGFIHRVNEKIYIPFHPKLNCLGMDLLTGLGVAFRDNGQSVRVPP